MLDTLFNAYGSFLDILNCKQVFTPLYIKKHRVTGDIEVRIFGILVFRKEIEY